MVQWDVTVGSVTLDSIFDVSYNNGRTEGLGEATVVCGNNTNNRAIESGDEIQISKNGTLDYRGYIIGKPTKAGASRTELEVKAVDKRMELKHQQVNRVFYETDTGEIIRKILNEKLVPFSFSNDLGEFIHKGESASEWDTNIPKSSEGGIVSLSLENQGSDFMFFGWPSGSGSQDSYHATYDSVPTDATVGDGQVDTFYTRLAINNNGGPFSAEVDLRDNFGNNYIWSLELPESGFTEFELKAEDAVSDANIGSPVSTDQTLEYRFSIDGTLAGARGVAIDYASAIPFEVDSRDTDITPGGVTDSGNVITRRIERSAFQTLKEFAVEDQFISYVDIDDVLHYENAGQNTAREIDFSSTNVVDAEFNRDYQDVTNKVTVQGDGDIRVTIPQPDSIEFYGVSSRDEPIVDTEIQTEEEAIRRGRGFLSNKAWDDEAFKFVIANTEYESVSLGDDILVNWPPENIAGTFQVSNSETDKDGLVTISITKRGTL